MRTIVVWVVAAAALLVPVSVIRVIAAFFLLTFFPGVLIWSYVDPDEKNPFVFIVCGAALLTVLVYYCAWVVWFFIPVVISFLCVILLEKKKILLPRIDRRTVYLTGCVLFMVLYLYPWSEYVDFYPPGDEMKLHLLYTNTIIQEKSLPSDYSPLYPEIRSITQPLGFHGLTAFVAGASRTSVIPASTLIGIVMAALGCISAYVLAKTLFSEEIGMVTAFSYAFLSFVSHQLAFSGSYTVLTGITFQICAAALIIQSVQQRSRALFIVTGLFCAACFSTDLNIFLPLMLFLVFCLILNRFLFPVVASFIIFSLPQLARFTLPVPTPLEIYFIEEWFQQNLAYLKELHIVLFSLGPFLVIFALLQMVSRKPDKIHQKTGFVLLYTISFCIPVLLSLVIPLWYFFDPVLIFRLIFIPLTVVSALFLVNLKEIHQFKWFLTGFIICAALVHITDPFTILPSLPPTVDADAVSAYTWISDTPPNATFCNFTSSHDSSTWIPITCNRKIFLPFHLYYAGDNAMSQLSLPERFTDAAILTSMPDSNFAKDILEKYNCSYVYIDEKSPVTAEPFITSSFYNLEFHQGDVYIFSVTDTHPVVYQPVVYHRGQKIPNGIRSSYHFSVTKGSILGIYYYDHGFGNIDVDINGTYVKTIYRFNTQNHFLVLFSLPSEECIITLFPFEDPFSVDYFVIFEAGTEPPS